MDKRIPQQDALSSRWIANVHCLKKKKGDLEGDLLEGWLRWSGRMTDRFIKENQISYSLVWINTPPPAPSVVRAAVVEPSEALF